MPSGLADGIIADAGIAKLYRGAVDVALQQAIGYDGPGFPSMAPFGQGGDIVDLRQVVTEALIGVVSTFLGRQDAGGVSDDHSPALLDRILTDPPTRPISDRLGALEMEGMREEASGGVSGEEVVLVRISAAAETPLAARFSTLFAESKNLDCSHRDGWVGRENFLRPEVKLAGNELANFSAFLDHRWRNNDWMWGRLDAASDLIGLVLKMAVDRGEPDFQGRLRTSQACRGTPRSSRSETN